MPYPPEIAARRVYKKLINKALPQEKEQIKRLALERLEVQTISDPMIVGSDLETQIAITILVQCRVLSEWYVDIARSQQLLRDHLLEKFGIVLARANGAPREFLWIFGSLLIFELLKEELFPSIVVKDLKLDTINITL